MLAKIRSHFYVKVCLIILCCLNNKQNKKKTYKVCKYMVMSRDQNAGRIHSVRIDNSTFERVEKFKYLGTNSTNQNSIAEEIKSRLRSGNASYHSVQNLLSSRLLSKNLKIKIYRTIILPAVFVWV